MSERDAIADEIECAMKGLSLLSGDDLRKATLAFGRLTYVHSSKIIAALRARDREDGARPDIAEAIKREAQQQKFLRDLAEASYATLKDRLCRAAHKAFVGDDRALRRLVETIENPKPIYGSAALASQETSDGR